MKKTITTITFAAIMTISATFANAGIIVAGRGANGDSCAQAKDGIIVAGRDGIIVAGITGIIVAGLTTILEDADQTCTTAQRDGIIVAG